MNAPVTRKPQIFVLDPNPAILDYIRNILADRFAVSLFTRAEALLDSLNRPNRPELLLMDWSTPDSDSGQGSEVLLSRIRKSRPSLPIVILACSTDLKEAIVVARAGADDVILKPFRKSDIEGMVQKCLASPSEFDGLGDNEAREIPLDHNVSFVLACKRMREIESQCRLVARADIPILILGESGTGKEVAAKYIHKMSARTHRDFLKVNCAAMPADLIESELFGYEQGAFTGAVKSKPGKFELCNGGTIFMDEIGEMPATLQAKLLQVLQDGSFSRLGGRYSVKVDVRVIAATNIDMKTAIAQKTFREDLYYRLNGFTVKMPPLRERTEEIPVLTRHFVEKVAAKYSCNRLAISPSLMKALCGYSWPGNLRELENTIHRYLILNDEHTIINDLSPSVLTESFSRHAVDASASTGLKNLVRNLKGDAEAVAIAQALENRGWNRKVAACDLKISYKALLYKIKQYNLNPPPKRYTFSPIAKKYEMGASEVA